MEQLPHLQVSRKGFQSHVTRLYNNVDKLMDNDDDEYCYQRPLSQLTDKQAKLEKTDKQIATLISDPHELESFIEESEELKDER